MAFSTFNSIQSFLMYVRASVGNLATFTYNFPALDPSLVLYYPMDSSANVGGGFKTANFASRLPVYDASLAGSAMITYALNNSVTSFGDLSLNNTMGSQLVAQTASGNYVVSNTTFAPNISGGFSISLWFSCSGQLNKRGTLISLPPSVGVNGLQIDISGPNMIYSGYVSSLTNGLVMHFPFNSSSIDIISGTDYFSGLTRTYKTSNPSPIFSPSYLDVTTNKLLNTNANLTQLNTTTLSFSCWMAFPSASLGNSGYYMIVFDPPNNIGLTITNKAYNATSGQGSNAISLEFYPGEVRINIIPSVIANQWYHIVFTINNTILNVYIDGIPLSGPVNAGTNSSTYTVTFPHTLSSSYISTIYTALTFGSSSGGNLPQTCYFDDVRFYNRILSPSDVTAIYNYRG